MWILIGLFACAAVIPLIIGSDYSEGTVRNKIVCGYTKGQIYLSEFLCAAAVSTLLYICMMIPLLISGYKGWVMFTVKDLVQIFIGLYLIYISLASIFVIVCCLIRNKAVSAIGCIGIMLVLYIGGNMVDSILSQPKYTEIYVIDEATNEQTVTRELNNSYMENGALRTSLTAAYKVNPCAQLGEYIKFIYGIGADEEAFANSEREECKTLPLYSLGAILVITSVGTAVYRRKDIK
jgi:ABC-type transport system involved in multi-copper enzyme maturation permease subunit